MSTDISNEHLDSAPEEWRTYDEFAAGIDTYRLPSADLSDQTVTIRLASPPGSQGVTIRRYGVSYEYTDPDTLGLETTGEVTLPVPPLEILPSQSDGAGKEATLRLSTNNALVTSKLVPNILNEAGQLRVGAFIVRYRFFSAAEAPDSTSGEEDTSVIKDETGYIGAKSHGRFVKRQLSQNLI